jgi:hypothetical protein
MFLHRCFFLLNIESQQSQNIFDNLPNLMKPTVAEQRDELDRYLSTDPKLTDDVLAWWDDRKVSFPCLSRMALDYLSIPGNFFVSLTVVG